MPWNALSFSISELVPAAHIAIVRFFSLQAPLVRVAFDVLTQLLPVISIVWNKHVSVLPLPQLHPPELNGKGIPSSTACSSACGAILTAKCVDEGYLCICDVLAKEGPLGN